jgi:hypothetical protein
MENDSHDAALKEAARVEAAKRISIAKFAAKTGGNYELAARLVEAVYKVFPLPPETPAKPSKPEEGKPDGD